MMAKEVQPFAAFTWSELAQELNVLSGEEALRQADFRWTEVTDLVQGQLFQLRSILALQMPRVIEIRLKTGAVAYLRTGIPVGDEGAALPAGALLLTLRKTGESGEHHYRRYPRVKRGPNWRSSLRHLLLLLVRDVTEDRPLRRGIAVVPDLLGWIEPETDDLEADLAPPRRRRSTARSEEPLVQEPDPDHESQGLRLQAAGGAAMDWITWSWTDLQPAGISLPVWLSGLLSLALLLAALLVR